MTAREKLAMEHPNQLNEEEPGGCMGCPEDYGYLPDADFCTNSYDRYGDLFERCRKCWDREIPEETKDEKENIMHDRCEENQCAHCIHMDVCSMKQRFLDAQRAVHELIIYNELPGGKTGQVRLRDIGFIKPVELACIHYIPKNTSFTR